MSGSHRLSIICFPHAVTQWLIKLVSEDWTTRWKCLRAKTGRQIPKMEVWPWGQLEGRQSQLSMCMLICDVSRLWEGSPSNTSKCRPGVEELTSFSKPLHFCLLDTQVAQLWSQLQKGRCRKEANSTLFKSIFHLISMNSGTEGHIVTFTYLLTI
jgi:hypothetical protein